ENTANPRFLRVSLHNNIKGSIGLNNEGFRGMGIKNNLRYDFSLMYRTSFPNIKMYVELINSKEENIGGTSITTTTTGDGWKKTIGPIEERQLIINRWNFEFAHRPTPDYFQTFGLGFFEYFQLAEDIGAEPLPILNAGMACQLNTAELVPLNQLDPYVQDAL